MVETNSLKSWLLAARPKTLPAAIVPVWVGNLPVLFGDGDFSWLLLGCTLLSCICIQIATNFFNDAIDFKKGADTEKRLGPIRVTASGMLSQKMVLVAAMGFCLLAALISIPMIMERGPFIIVIGVISLFLAYGYTGGPVPLAYRGLGELFVILFFGFVAVVGSYWVQTGEWPVPLQVWLLALMTGLYSTVLIAINNLRDVAEDSGTGKRTLAVRFGKRFARIEIFLLVVTPAVIGFLMAFQTRNHFGEIGFVILLIVGQGIAKGVRKNEPGPIYNKYLALSGLMLIGFAVVITLFFWRI